MNRLLGYKKFKDEIEKDDKIQNNIVEKGCERNIKKIFFKVCTVCLIKKKINHNKSINFTHIFHLFAFLVIYIELQRLGGK